MGSMDGGAADGSRDVAGEEKKEKEREREMREREGRLRRWGETLQVRLRFENSVLCLSQCSREMCTLTYNILWEIVNAT